jgi:hypothetical protein
MRRVVILLVIVGIAYAAVLGFGAAKQTQGGVTTQSGFVQTLGRLTAPFAPRLPFPDATVTVAAGTPYRWNIPPSGEPVRVARFTLQSGPLAEFRVCPPNSFVPCGIQAVCAVPHGVQLPSGSTCAQNGEPGPTVTVSARKEDGMLWIAAPNGPVTLRRE